MQLDLNKIIEKFRYDPNSVKKGYDGKTDIYLAKVGYRYAYIARVLAVVAVLVCIALILSGNLSYNKLYYLAKDIKLAGDYVSTVHDTITYNVGNSQSFIEYRSGIAVASRERLSIFSAGGRELFSSNHSYGNPNLRASNQYVLLYDVGGKQFSLYNSFSKVSDEVLNYSIYDACISNDGSFAIITRSDDYDSIVRVYKPNGAKYDYNFSQGRVTAIALSESGRHLAVAIVRSEGLEISTELRLYQLGSGDYLSSELSFSGIPYEIKIFDNGNVASIGANGVNVFSSSLNLLGEYLSDEEIYTYSFGDDNIVASHIADNQSKTEVLIFNKRGRVERAIEFDDRVLGVAIKDGYLFTQTIGSFARTNISIGTSQRIDLVATDFKMIASERDTLIVCNNSYAKFLYFK